MMKVLERLPVLSLPELKQVEKNASDKLGTEQNSDALKVLAAVTGERQRRASVAKITARAEQEAVRLRFQSSRLFDRVVAAFTDHPPQGWERNMIVALCANPGSTTEELSQTLGYSGSYMNWFGMVCKDRVGWLGPATTIERPSQDTYASDVLVDFGQRIDPISARKHSTWTFKPEVLEAFQAIGLA